MAQAETNGIRIEYDTFGAPDGRPLVLIMGLASQMVGWPPDFCSKLVDRGHYVVRFDNRDVGLSSKIEEAGVPSLESLMTGSLTDGEQDAPYRLRDMAADTAGLLDALGLEQAHVCGISMGGMIAQTLTIRHPERVRSLISLESTTGEAGLPPPTPEAAEGLFRQPPEKREAYIEHMVHLFKTFAAGSPEFDEAVQTEISSQAFDRSHYPMGFLRQMAAIMASGGRGEALGSVTVPVLALHGSLDPLLSPAHGRATAAAVPGAAFHMVKDLGHGMAYPRLWDEMADRISEHTENAA